jgi:hypothetical protein
MPSAYSFSISFPFFKPPRLQRVQNEFENENEYEKTHAFHVLIFILVLLSSAVKLDKNFALCPINN